MFVRALCQALAYAHEHGVVHRDVKPENVLYDQLGQPRLADFGIAFTNRVNTRVTAEGSTLGSVAYMSPEQARGRAVDRRSDIYSLGVVCYECLTGKLPFSGQDSMSMALAHVEQPIPRLPAARRHWQSFIDKAMAKKPDDRFQSAEQMLAALDALSRRMVIVAPVSAIASSLAEVPQQFKRSRTRMLGISATLIAGLLILVAGYALHQQQSAPSAAHEAAAETKPVESPIAATPIEQTSNPTANEGDTATPTPPQAAASPAVEPPPPEPQATTTPAQQPSGSIRDDGGPEVIIVPAQVQHANKSYDVGHAFALGRFEVTRAEYEQFARASGRGAASCRQPMRLWSALERLNWRSPGFAQNDHHPVVCVSWDDANAYAQWLSQRTHHRYRLPSQGEWIHAARLQSNAGSVCKRGNVYDASTRGVLHLASRYDCSDGYAQTAPVGRFEAGDLGIYDLLGNVSEWTRDCVAEKSAKRNAPCAERIFRGISWRDGPDRHNLEFSGTAAPDMGFTTVGFRVLRELEDAEAPAASAPPQ
jgi:formylglycine-generating enzyme required for sulfatase activity